MNIGKACGIFMNIHEKKYRDKEKFEAVYQTINLETLNGVTKAQIVDAFKFVLNMKTGGTLDTEKERIRLENANLKKRIGEQREKLKKQYDDIERMKKQIGTMNHFQGENKTE